MLFNEQSGLLYTAFHLHLLDTLLNCKLPNCSIFRTVYPTALRKTKIAYNFGLSECSRVKVIISVVPVSTSCMVSWESTNGHSNIIGLRYYIFIELLSLTL